MRIDGSGNIGIGTTSGFSGRMTISESNKVLNNRGNLNVYTTNSQAVDLGGQIGLGGSNGSGGSFDPYSFATLKGAKENSTSNNFAGYFAIGTAVAGGDITERMRIASEGSVTCAGAGSNVDVITPNAVGISLNTNATIQASRTSVMALQVNRRTTDGDLVGFFQDGTQEGTISVAGNTVSYNGFTGSHWSRFIDKLKPDVLRGTVMESLDQMTDWYLVKFEVSYTTKDSDGNDVVKTVTNRKPYALKANEQEGDVITYAWNTEKKDEEGNDIIEQVQATIVKQKDVKHVMSKISDTVEAKNVYGVFSAWDNDDLINNDFYVASVGSYVVRIKAGQTVSKGDLLQSNGDGTAKVQADDMIRASTFAKVLSNTVIQTYEDGSFIVPCSLMC